MRSVYHLAVALMLTAGVVNVDAAPEKPPDAPPSTARPEALSLAPSEVLRGLPVTVSGKEFDKATAIRIRLNATEIQPETARSEDGKTIVFRIPPDFPLGRYTVRVVFILKDAPQLVQAVPVPAQNNQIRVISDAVEKVKLTGIHPLVGYPADGTFAFRVLGEGFSLVPTDNQLHQENSGVLPVNWLPTLPEKKNRKTDRVYGHVVSSRQLEFWGVPQSDHEGKLKFQISVGDATSEAVPVTLARVGKAVPWIVSIVVVLLLALMVIVPVARGVGKHNIGDTSYRPLASFLLDKESDTLSLSKFQLYVWTAVAVFGYTYLTLARSLIQGVFEFAPIPEGLPGILGISAGTAVLASGINSSRGPKGAGDVQPRFADLITTGGVVVAERFQFLLWTVLGALAFLFLVVFSDPATIQDLPKVPEGFLYLMGISSSGYLGGKLARKPGPVIDAVVAQRGSVVIDIQGRNLSRDASFRIDDLEVTCDILPQTTATTISGPAKDATVEVVRKDDSSAQSDFALALRLKLANETTWLSQRRIKNPELPVEADWLKAEHRLTLINPDGQKAIWPFTIKPKVAP